MWARQREFRLDATIGAPPDAFSAEGQDWGLPVMRWDGMAENGHAWWRARCRRAAALFDGVRLDHVIGYYRIYERPAGGTPFFQPADEGAQRALGEHLLAVASRGGRGLDLIGEDLGSVPEFVRQSLARLDIPGFRVLRWEHDGGTFRDPRGVPGAVGGDDRNARHVVPGGVVGGRADGRPAHRCRRGAGLRRAARARRSLDAGGPGGAARRPVRRRVAPGDPALHGHATAAASASTCPPPSQDTNWTYRVPWTVDQLLSEPGAALAGRLRDLAARTGRLP